MEFKYTRGLSAPLNHIFSRVFRVLFYISAPFQFSVEKIDRNNLNTFKVYNTADI